ncbi:MAG: alpha/beta fold hydrolase [Pseudorhodobacter sp.]
MTVTLIMPRLGETMEEGTVSRWLVETGQRFERGAPLIEFETDKTAVEYPALGPGRLVEVLVGPGDLVEVGAPLAQIDLEGGEDWISTTQTEEAPPARQAEPVQPAVTDNAQTVAQPGGPVRATPLARRAARQAGIDIAGIRGTGRRGRIELADVKRAGSAGGSLAASEWGPETGPSVLLIHGFAGDRTSFDQLGRGLGRAGFHVRAIDLPGHGETEIEARDFDDLLAGLRTEIPATGHIHLVGHSLGAALAIKAAEAGNTASLTLIAPAGLGYDIDAEFIHGMARAEGIGTIGHLLRRLSPRAAAFSSELIAHIHADLSRGRLRDLAEAIAPGGGAAQGQAINVVPALTALVARIPVRTITGHCDRIVSWADTMAVSPGIAVHHFPEAGHMPHWDLPAEVEAIIVKGITHGT